MTWWMWLMVWAGGNLLFVFFLPKPGPTPDPFEEVVEGSQHFSVDKDTGDVLYTETRRDPMTGLTLTKTTNLGEKSHG